MNANDEQDRFHSRRNPRLKKYDYTTPNYYFVTICTREKRCLFWHRSVLSKYGEIAKQGFEEIGYHFPDVIVDKFVVMPNHVHGILVLQGGRTNLSSVIGQYKSYVSKQIHAFDTGCKVWQASFHDHVIRNQQDYERIWLYIEANPARWDEDCFYLSE